MKQIILPALVALSSGIVLHGDYNGQAPFYDDSFYGTGYSGFPGTEDDTKIYAPKYKREMPERFANKHLDDMFMHSMIETYSKEGRNPDGSKNGKFYLD
tara:strand:+ start:36 stop:332 length:297 start_codon:yes stop_codon:yes gene_type:complete